MLIHGYCRLCHRIKRVRVTGLSLALAQAQRGIVVGECSDCTEGHRCDNYAECRGFQATHQGAGRWLCSRCLVAERRAQRLNRMEQE